jgi:hypothetical protein
MLFVLLSEHAAEVCPLSNAKTRDLLLQMAPNIPKIAQQNGVTIVAGPFVNREHLVVSVVEADRSESVDEFLRETRLAQWNSVRILPSLSMEEGLKEIQESTSLSCCGWRMKTSMERVRSALEGFAREFGHPSESLLGAVSEAGGGGLHRRIVALRWLDARGVQGAGVGP